MEQSVSRLGQTEAARREQVVDPMTGRWAKAMVLSAATLAAAPSMRAAVAEESAAPAAAPSTSLAEPADLTPTHRPISPADFNREDPMPVELQGVEVTEKLGGSIPLDLTFVDETGQRVVLSDYFDGKTPVILNLTYFRCPMSCPMILQNLATSLKGMDLEPGEGGYRVLTVSIDPTDTPNGAAMKKKDTLQTLERAGGDTAWPFLIGTEQNIQPLAEAVGYGYKYLPGPRQYTHRDVVMVLSPDGRVMRYLYGRSTPSMTVQLSLVEASQGKVGTTKDAILLYCFYYDTHGKYSLAARRLMTAGGAVTVVVLSGVLGALWVRERLRGSRNAR